MSRDFTFADLVLTYQSAAWPVLNSPEIWREEQESTETRLRPWPLPDTGTKFVRLMYRLAHADIVVTMVLMRSEGDPRSPDWPPDVRDPKLQVLLRVAMRSMEAGEAAVIKTIGPGRITGLREFKNMVAEQMDAYARTLVRPGLTLDQVLELLQLPRSTTFRANRRRHNRRKSHFVRD